MKKKTNKKKPPAKAVKNKRQPAGKGGSRKTLKAAAQSAPPPEKSNDKELFKFRRYKKAEGSKAKKLKHPKLIVDKQKETVTYMGLTESPKRGHHKNIELEKNPQKGNSKKAYLRGELRQDSIDNFGEVLKDYNLSNKDKKKVIEYIKKLKKK